MVIGAVLQRIYQMWSLSLPVGQLVLFTDGTTLEHVLGTAPDGSSIITSIGLHESALWIHDKRVDRALSSEGYVSRSSARFSSDGKLLFYLMRHYSSSSSSELWRRDLGSGKSQTVLPGISVVEYDISSDAEEVVYSTQPPGKASQLWLSNVYGSAPPRLIASPGVPAPHFV